MMKRRIFLQNTLAAGAASVAVSTGLLSTRAFAETPATPAPEAAATDTPAVTPFSAPSLDEALKALNITLEASDKVSIKAPEIAENGAVVPVTLSSTLEGVTELGLLVAENPTPLAAIFKLSEGTLPSATTRIKMGKTSDVIAFARVGDKTYSAKQEVKVTIGGCGG